MVSDFDLAFYVGKFIREPVESFVQSGALSCTRCLYVPLERERERERENYIEKLISKALVT